MANQQFSINQKVFEIDFFSKAKAYALQDRISSLVNGELPVLMNRYFETVIPEDFLLKIDTLTLDIGSVRYDHLESDLTARFMEVLMEEMGLRLRELDMSGASQQSGTSVTRIHTGKTDLLEYFLLTGRLPWWADTDTDIEKILSDMYHENPAGLRELIVQVGRYDYVRRRLVNRFAAAQLRMIIEVLTPSEAEFIVGYHAQVLAVQREEQLVKAEEKEFEKAVWLFILNYLLAERGGEFNRKIFVRDTLAQIAANFNVAYLDLLNVFFNAVQRENNLSGYTGSLEKIIREISAEDRDFAEREELLYAPRKQASASVEEMMDQLTLLDHYLSYGTMPAGAGELTQQQLVELFFETAAKLPDTFRRLLLRHVNSIVSQRLFGLLGAQGVKRFVRIVYPSKARIITHVGATFEMLQAEKVLVSASANAFQDVLWKMILDIVLVSGMMITDDRVIIQSLIEQIRRTYGMPVAMLVDSIKEGIGSVFYKSMGNLQHIELFQRVIETYETDTSRARYTLSMDESFIATAIAAAGSASIDGAARVAMRDLLRFLVMYGSIPWWGREYASQSPVQLLRQLLQGSPSEAFQLLKFAGAVKTSKDRVLMLFPEELILSIFRVLPGGELSVRLYEQLKVIALLAAPGTDALLLTNILWDELSDRGYTQATEMGLYTKAATRLAAVEDTAPTEMLQRMQNAIAGWTGDAVVHLQRLLQSIAMVLREEQATRIKTTTRPKAKKRGDYVLQEYLLSASIMVEVPAGQTEVGFVREWLTAAEESIRAGTLSKVFVILEQYLLLGRLPDSVGISDVAIADAFLKKLLILAYEVEPQRLAALFDNRKGEALAVVHLTGLLNENAGGEEKAVALFLQPAIEESGYPFNRLPVTEQVTPVNEPVVPIEWYVSAYLGEGAALPSPNASSAKMIEGAASLLEYFILWNRFPSILVFPEGGGYLQLLKRLLIVLFKENKELLTRVLLINEYQSAAVMSVYGAVSAAAGGDEKLTAVFIAEVLQSRISRISQQENEPRIILPPPPETFADVPGGESIEEAEEAMFAALITENRYQPFTAFADVTDSMIALLSRIFTDTLVQDRMISLFRKFNLQLSASNIVFSNRSDYFISFFEYIRQYRSPVTDTWQKILAYLEVTDAEQAPALLIEDIAVMRRSLRTLLKQEDDRHDAADAMRRGTTTATQSSQDAAAEGVLSERQRLKEQVAKELEAERLRAEEEGKRKALEKVKEKDARIYISNAGLVILHPFFSTYFSRVGLMEKGQFIDKEKQSRGVLLLQYLVSGRTKFEEHELVLNKILCGMEIEEPVAIEIELSEPEKTIADELFEVLKQRWEKVKNSSIEGMRASFFMRDGGLQETEEGWVLRVEQRGYDMLLQTLPWAFGFIKTSWMNKILTVEWI